MINIFNRKKIYNDLCEKINNKEHGITKYKRLYSKLKNYTYEFEYPKIQHHIHNSEKSYINMDKFITKFRNKINFRTNNHIEFNYGKESNIDYYESFDKYSNSYRYTKVIQNIDITMNFNKLNDIISKNLLICDNIITFEILNIKQINDIEIFHIYYIKQSKGSNFSLKRCYLARYIIDNDIFYYHAESVKKAYNGVIKKSKKVKKEKNFQLTLNSVITKKLYQKLTGACNLGINDFIAKNGLENVKSMKLNELLPLLKNEYGYNKIVKMLENK